MKSTLETQPVDENCRKSDEEGASQWIIARNPNKYLPQSIFRYAYI